ncbi:hypothetical protein HK099_001861, partial [Clydaea vesicula]
PEIINDNQKYVDQFIQCILVARLYLFNDLQQKLKTKLTPELWLFVQLFPERYYSHNFFTILVEILRHLKENDLKDMLNSLVQKIPEKLLAIFLDESQLIVDVGSDSFPSKSTPGATCSLLNAIKNSISNEAEKFCFIPTGTGLRIGDVHGEGSKLSSAAKDSKQSLILTVSNVWETPDDIQKYLSRYLGSSFILEKEKACLLLGRVRPVALFLEQCLVCIDTDFEINNYFEEF